eukprot:CAMPEP_0172487526 /NCGR_PEP_ID=MMETSP1066-20121228/16674_1 /TAXON_ID=671091 /ORGANISM="Coscinodiscus wailesii, Strain CCMP2513" /LENGTH=100 /DNA_ID=CAMNT_0013254211 /DNA_START=333 /DNA_END=635 /DNA_ORIENTATION=+
MSPATLRPDHEQSVLNKQSATSSRGDGINIQLWRLDRYARRRRFENVFEMLMVPRHVGGGSAHVESDDGGGCGGGFGDADDSPRRTGEYGFMTTKVINGG